MKLTRVWLLLFASIASPASLASPTAGAAHGDTPVGTWYFHIWDARFTAEIATGPGGTFTGTATDEAGGHQILTQIGWDAGTGRLEFCREGENSRLWFRGTVVEGVFKGRYAETSASAPRPESANAFRFHATAWNSAILDRGNFPRVFDLLIGGESRARLRIDADARGGRFIGRLKIYATVSERAAGEQLEEDVDVTLWDGRRIAFVRHAAQGEHTFRGTVRGRGIEGMYTPAGSAESLPWRGWRAEVLTYGMQVKSAAARAEWQQRTRRRLLHLMMSGQTEPLTARVTTIDSGQMPLASKQLPPERDDDPEHWPRNYRISELQFDFTLANPYSGAALARRAHGYLATPVEPATAKVPAILMINGHGGSAHRMLDADDALYWYGESFARRGYVVLALDFSHRPTDDRRFPDASLLYDGSANGDDPARGNAPHPAIKAEGFDSDFEEDGERVWDAMRGLDYLLTLPQVDATRVGVAGLSMGGTLAALTAALDPRVAFAIPIAPASDVNVMFYKGNHSCWLWMHGDIREYFESSDLLALIAPRPALVITGKGDATYSRLNPPFASDKQVLRRARVAYAGAEPNLVHYLHSGGHRFRAGDGNPTLAESGLRTPTALAPSGPGDRAWQTDTNTVLRAATVFDLLKEWLKPK